MVILNKQKIQNFFQSLSRIQSSGRIYVAGGAALVHADIRSAGTTEDIDLLLVPSSMDQAFQQLARKNNIALELASPGDFLPLPSGWENRSRFIGRYGSIDVFYFDFLCSALSKLERGSNRDIQDINEMIKNQVVTVTDIDNAYTQIIPLMGKGRYRAIRPDRLIKNYERIRPNLK